MAKSSRGEWEMFHKRVWSTSSFRALTTDARLLYLWTWTNEDASLAGIYEASPRQIARALADVSGPPDEQMTDRLAAALRELSQRPLVLYDEDAWVLWVVGRVEHTLRSPKVAIRMRRDWEECPASPLKQRFADTYGERLGLGGGNDGGG